MKSRAYKVMEITAFSLGLCTARSRSHELMRWKKGVGCHLCGDRSPVQMLGPGDVLRVAMVYIHYGLRGRDEVPM